MLANQQPLEMFEPIESDNRLLRRILAPYIPTGTDYLKSSELIPAWYNDIQSDNISLARMSGQFSIPNSCYIKATGHFNAVEFLICYNQIAYALFGALLNIDFFKSHHVDSLPTQCKEALSKVSLASFFENQLTSMLVLKASSRFKGIIDAKNFKGTISINKIKFKRSTFFIETTCIFEDNNGGYADGEILLAYPLKLSH